MRAAIPHRLWLGNALEGRDPRRLYDAGIAAIVDLAMEESPAQLPRDLVYCRFPVIDGAGNSRELLVMAVETVAALIRKEIPTLVCCGAGMSRSPAIVAAALAVAKGKSPEEQLQSLVIGAPHDVSPVLWTDVVAAVVNARPATAR
jgi:protein-tyrosine phosphatase